MINPHVLELDEANAGSYVAAHWRIPIDQISVTALGGGVSNAVLLIETPGSRFVLKQSLGQLRVDEPWFSDRERIWREASVMRMLAPVLPPGSVPGVIFEDRPNCIYGMTAAPAGAPTWKSDLLQGHCDPSVAEQVGDLLAALFRAGWESPQIEREHGDRVVFDQLRLTPYYGQCAERHPDLAPFFHGLIEACIRRSCTLIHGDWSPKNILVAPGQPMTIDFEVAHYGDPSFDAGFLLNHLLLKSFHRTEDTARYAELADAFWRALRSGMPRSDWFEPAAIEQWAGLLLARVDGRSPAEYIRDPEQKQLVRTFARSLITDRPRTILEVFDRRLRCH